MMHRTDPSAAIVNESSESHQSTIVSGREGEVIPAATGRQLGSTIMKITTAHRIVPALALAFAGAAIALAPIAGADANPLVPYGTSPQVKVSVGLHTANQDEVDTTNGIMDLPF
jgi:hypothetical protein